MKTLSFRLAASAIVLGAAFSAHAYVLIDDFNVPQTDLALYTTTQNGTGYADLGDDVLRSTSLVQTENTDPGYSRSRISIKNGMLNYSNDAGVTSTGYVSYLFTSLKNMAGTTGFRLDFLSNDLASEVKAYVTDDAYNTSVYSVAIPSQTTAFSRTLSYVSGGADLSHVQNVSFKMGGVMDEDLRIDRVQSVPEPASLAALGVGAVGLLRRRRKA